MATTVRRIVHGAFRNDAALLASMHELVAPSYDGVPAVLDYELAICDTLYLLTDELGLVSFFMTAATELQIADARVPAFFMGLGATRQSAKGRGQIRDLFLAFADDVRAREATTTERVLLFATFATPSTLYAFETLFVDVAPVRSGGYRDEYLPALPAIRDFLRTSADPQCPFRLPRHAKGTRYSVSERLRLADICRRKNFTLFEMLDVDEARGDRLVLCAHAPHTRSEVTSSRVDE